MQAISIPVTTITSYDWLNSGVNYHEKNGTDTSKWYGIEFEDPTPACQHHNTSMGRAYPDDDYTDMARISCDACGQTLGFEN